ncbi:hypothetical protein PUN28_008294 [Cardiocondyla obscurior]|uniref:Uncharacterized protein n=1 Tax=Cardiocondyla obscurior TaxID=286306 RepID=A0AAW2FYG2_9HYME
MVDTIEKALSPLSVVALILGFGILSYPRNYWRFGFSIFYTLIVWCLYFCAFHFMISAFSPKRIFNSHLTLFTLNINFLVTVISVINTISRYQVYIFLSIFYYCFDIGIKQNEWYINTVLNIKHHFKYYTCTEIDNIHNTKCIQCALQKYLRKSILRISEILSTAVLVNICSFAAIIIS